MLNSVLENFPKQLPRIRLDFLYTVKAELIQITNRLINIVLTIACASAVWNCLRILTNSESPVYLVPHYDMKPTYDRGDLLFL